MTRLYEEEASWHQEKLRIQEEMEAVETGLRQQMESDHDGWMEEKAKMESQEQRLMESVKMLSQDNAKLIKEREDEQINQSKTHQVEFKLHQIL